MSKKGIERSIPTTERVCMEASVGDLPQKGGREKQGMVSKDSPQDWCSLLQEEIRVGPGKVETLASRQRLSNPEVAAYQLRQGRTRKEPVNPREGR